MAEQRHRTVIELGIDDRELRGLDQTMHRAFDERTLAAFERTLDRSARTMERMLRVTERFEQLMRRMPGMPSAGGGAGGGGGGGGGGGQDLAALARSIDRLAQVTQRGQAGGGGGGSGGGSSFASRTGSTALGTYLGGLGRAAGGGGFVSSTLGGIPLVGGMLAGAANQVQSLYGEHTAAQQGVAQHVGQTGTTKAPGFLNEFGLDRPGRMGALSQFSQGTSMTGRQMAQEPGLLRTMASAQYHGGIQGGGADLVQARMTGATTPGAESMMTQGPVTVGGGDAMSGLVQQGIGYGLESGIREPRLGQFMSAAANQEQQSRLAGGSASSTSSMQLTAALARLGPGLGGEAGQRVAMNMGDRGREFQPQGQDLSSMILLQAAGYPSVGYLEAMKKIQNNDPEVFANARGMLQDMGGGAGTAGATFLMHRLGAGVFGGQTGQQIKQAESLAGGGPMVFESPRDAEGAGRRFLQQREQDVGGAYTNPATEARHRDRRAEAGRRVGPTARMVRDFELDITESVVVPLAKAAAAAVGWVQRLFEAFQTGGVPAAAAASASAPAPAPTPGSGSGPGSPKGWQRSLGSGTVKNTAAAGSNPKAEAGGPSASAAGGSGAGGPTASAADMLRRMSRDAASAADILDAADLPREGDMAVG